MGIIPALQVVNVREMLAYRITILIRAISRAAEQGWLRGYSSHFSLIILKIFYLITVTHKIILNISDTTKQ